MAEYIVRETSYPLAAKAEVIGELIRCKDCKHWHQFSSCSAFPEYHECSASGFAHIQTTAEEFCNRAERKEDG